MSCKNNQKVVIAAGGTGGHLFPAQALARSLMKEGKGVVFSGCGLKENKFFSRDEFPFRDITGATVFKKNPFIMARGVFKILKGVVEGIKLLTQEEPAVVIGFGSYHSFPVLAAALIKRVPIILFESNSHPGKVNQLLARFAKLNAVQFLECQRKMKAPVVEVAMPLWIKNENALRHTPQEARQSYGLNSNARTILIFGGSQGAEKINHTFLKAVEELSKEGKASFQVIHIIGKGKDKEEYKHFYTSHEIISCVKEFEDNMPLAYMAADLVICRSGAATVAEIMAFAVPAIFVPYPHSLDDHQVKNAEVVVGKKGGMLALEKDLTFSLLKGYLKTLFQEDGKLLKEMKASLIQNRESLQKKTLSSIIVEFLEKGQRHE